MPHPSSLTCPHPINQHIYTSPTKHPPLTTDMSLPLTTNTYTPFPTAYPAHATPVCHTKSSQTGRHPLHQHVHPFTLKCRLSLPTCSNLPTNVSTPPTSHPSHQRVSPSTTSFSHLQVRIFSTNKTHPFPPLCHTRAPPTRPNLPNKYVLPPLYERVHHLRKNMSNPHR